MGTELFLCGEADPMSSFSRLRFLADDEEAGFQSQNIKKCVLHYLLEIFNPDDSNAAQPNAQSIWDFITEHVT